MTSIGFSPGHARGEPSAGYRQLYALLHHPVAMLGAWRRADDHCVSASLRSVA